VVANGNLHRFFAGDKTAGVYMSGFYVVLGTKAESIAEKIKAFLQNV